ncbi:MAG: MFS transporter [Syntrophales bacterium]
MSAEERDSVLIKEHSPEQEEIRKAAFWIATISSFLTPFMGSAVNIALPSIGDEFSLKAVTLSWVSTVFLLSAAIGLVPIGRLSDIYGRKRIFLQGIVLYTFASLLCALAFSADMLILCRALQGIGSAMIFGTGTAILVSVFPQQERGKVLGFNVAAVYFGLSVGPFAGGLFTQYGGWRSIFLINIPLGAFVIFLVRRKLNTEWLDAAGEKFDLSGSILYGAAVISFMYGFSILPGLPGLSLIAAGVILFIVFGFRETRSANPVLDVGLFRESRVFRYSNIAALINYSSTFAVGFLLSLYLQFMKGFSPFHSGLILASQPVMQSLFSPLAGRLSDRIEPRIIASSGMFLTFLSLLALVFLKSDTGLVYIISALIILGLGFALFSSPNVNAIMSSVDRKFYGVASGILATMRMMGQTLSMGVVMLTFSVFIGGSPITAEHHPNLLTSMKTVFIVLTSLCFAGIFASSARGKMHEETRGV